MNGDLLLLLPSQTIHNQLTKLKLQDCLYIKNKLAPHGFYCFLRQKIFLFFYYFNILISNINFFKLYNFNIFLNKK